MMRTTPLRRTTLQFRHSFFTDALTFIMTSKNTPEMLWKQRGERRGAKYAEIVTQKPLRSLRLCVLCANSDYPTPRYRGKPIPPVKLAFLSRLSY